MCHARERRAMPKVLVAKMKERNPLENLGVNARIMAKRILTH